MNAKSIFQANTLAHTTSPFRVNVINEKSILNKSRKGRTRKIVCLTIWHSNRRNEINHRPCMGRERSSLWMLFLCSLEIIIEINHFTTHSRSDPQTDPPFSRSNRGSSDFKIYQLWHDDGSERPRRFVFSLLEELAWGKSVISDNGTESF